MQHAFVHDAVRASCGLGGGVFAEARPDDLVRSSGGGVVVVGGRIAVGQPVELIEALREQGAAISSSPTIRATGRTCWHA
jgi:hypothetical protein